jgi:probable phosphomutase (TIGR03848 family)
VATCLLIRHGHSTANADGILSGRTPGVRLSARGRAQAEELAGHIAGIPIARFLSSPLQRCVETAALLAGTAFEDVVTDKALGECGYGAWTGRRLADLVADPLWETVQKDPASARFPPDDRYAAESLTEMTARVWTGLERLDAEVEQEHGGDAVWVAVSHGDPIRSAIASALGSRVAGLQRSHVDPGSVTCLRWSAGVPFLIGSNGDGASLNRWLARPAHDAPPGSALPGGDV